MGALCFVVDLLCLTPSLLEDLKQCLLELANYYAISPSQSLEDRIGLCYVFYNHATSSHAMRISYNPNGASGSQFNLKDFHYAVKSIPVESSFADITHSQTLNACPVVGEKLLSDQLDYLWSTEDVIRKVIVLTSSLPQEISPALSKAFMDVADKCIAIEVLLFETKSSHLCNVQTCKRHGTTLVEAWKDMTGRPCYPVTGWDLSYSDVIRETLIVGEKTVLFKLYSLDILKRQKVSPLIDFHVTERTNLASLNEGIYSDDIDRCH